MKDLAARLHSLELRLLTTTGSMADGLVVQEARETLAELKRYKLPPPNGGMSWTDEDGTHIVEHRVTREFAPERYYDCSYGSE